MPTLHEEETKKTDSQNSTNSSQAKAALVRHLNSLGFSDAAVDDINQVNQQGFTPLQVSILNKDRKAFVSIVGNAKNLNFNKKSDNELRQSALHLAIIYKDIAAIDSLVKDSKINVNVNVNVIDIEGSTPLHLAIKHKNINAVESLLNHSEIKANIPDNKGSTPLHVAVKLQDADAVKSLLNQKKIDLNQQNNEHQTPYSLAKKIKNEEIETLIRNKLAEQRKNQQEETHKEREREKNKNKEQLEEQEKKVLEEERAKKVLEEERAKKVLEEERAKKVLEEERAKKSLEEKDELVRHLTNLRFSDAAVENINQVNEQGETLLHVAAKFRDEDAIKFLLNHSEIDVNATDKEGSSPLHLFMKSEATSSSLRSLLNLQNHSKINFNATDNEGHTPLYYAITKNQKNISEFSIIEAAFLLAGGADIIEGPSKALNEKQLGLLTIACLFAHRIEDAKLLLKEIPNLKKNYFGVFSNGTKGLEDTAIASNCDEQIFEKIVNNDGERTFKNSDEMANFLKFTMAKSFLSSSYSEQSDGNPVFEARNLTFDKLIQSSASKSDNQQINSLIKKITNQEKIELSEGHKIEVICSNFYSHTAYLVIESDAQENPIKIAYCDGQNRSVKTAEIEKTNLEKLKCEFLEKTNFVNKEWGKKNSPSSFLEKIDGTKNFEDKIPVKPQKRGNCSLKSFNMTLRYVLSRTNPELVFEEKSGSGYEIYKNWKHSLIQAYRDDLNQLATAKDEKGNLLNEGKFWWKDLVQLQTKVLEKEASKKDDKPNSLQPTSATSLKNANCCTIS